MSRLRRRAQDGFTILDGLIAIVVLTIGLTGLSAMQLLAIRDSARVRELNEAAMLAHAKAEELSILPLPLPTPPSKGEVLDARGCVVATDQRAFCLVSLPGVRYTRTWVIDPANPRAYVVQTQWRSADGRTHQTVVAGGR